MDISRRTARRFILGRQGLWPGRRWQGIAGTERAMRTMEHVQLDPLAIMARAQDLMLHSRVIDYTIDDWATLTYERRRFFDWGGWLALRPMSELPYWRVLMRREVEQPHWVAFAHEHAAAIAEMREVLRTRPEVANRDFAMAERTRVDSYRGRKDSAIALNYLWRVGEAMITRRQRFERVYAAPHRVAPRRLLIESSDADADDFLLRKQVAFEGLSRLTSVSRDLVRPVSPAELTGWRERRLADGTLVEVRVEGWTGVRWALAADAPALRAIERGRVPSGWQPLDTTTEEETTFLAPLDQVSARGRAKPLFGFDYTWEVYTPAAKRRFGYYALPVLWGDRLVARFDGRLDRSNRMLHVLGLWLEDEALATDEGFIEAFARGMTRYGRFLGAERIEASAVTQPSIRRRLTAGRPDDLEVAS
jgi:uncharacterized protein YcaQ